MMSLVLSEGAVHLRDFVQSKKAASEDGRLGWVIVLASGVTAELCNPRDGLAQSQWMLCMDSGVPGDWM